MKFFTTKTLALLGLAALMGALTLIEPSGFDTASDLPALPQVDRAQVTRIEVTVGQGETVIMEGSLEDGFFVIAPYKAAADTIALRPLLALFEREKTRMDLAVDQGNLELYGLDDANGVLVELYTDGDQPALAFIVGEDRQGGASFVRLPGSETVYRGKVGSRQRYARDPLEWRDKMVTQLPVGLVQEVDLRTLDGERLVFRRLPEGEMATDASSRFGAWSSPQADFSLDQKSVDALAKTLSELRAGRILSDDFEGGFEPPAVTASFLMVSGDRVTLSFGTTRAQSGAAYLRRADREGVYMVSGSVLDRILRPPLAYRNRTLFAFQRVNVSTYTLQDSLGRAVLEQNRDTHMWAFVEPLNMDTDVLAVTQSINTLGELRADAIDPEISAEEAGIADPVSTLTARFYDGTESRLLVGNTIDIGGTAYTYVARPELLPILYLLRADSVSHLRAAFNRTQ